MTDATPVLQMQAASKTFTVPAGRVDVLRSVNVTVRHGDFVGLTGPSGSGKSTFLNLAAMLDTPSSGRVLFEGRDMSVADEATLCAVRKCKIGMVFQTFCLLPYRTSLENVAFRFRYLDTDRAESERRAAATLDALGLAHLAQRPVRLLSGGEMQRVAIARAVALRPTLLLADEPTGNLDRTAAETVMATFKQLNDEGLSVILATHNETLLPHCSRRLACRDGAILDHEA